MHATTGRRAPAPRHRTPLTLRSPFGIGFFAAVGALVAWWLGGLLLSIGSVLVLIVVSMFLAVGLNPAVEWLGRRGLKRSLAVLTVVVVVTVDGPAPSTVVSIMSLLPRARLSAPVSPSSTEVPSG